MRQTDPDLTTGPVGRRLFGVGAPMSLGILGVLSVGLADAYFLARVGSAELAAVGFIYPVIVALSAFAIGISAGANAALSQAIGAGREPRAVARLALHALGFGSLIGIAIAAPFWAGSNWLFSTLGATDAVLDAILVYTPFWAASFPFLIATMVLEATFRASGDGITPALTMLLTAVMNVALTPLLAFGYGPIPPLGIAGAGLATLLARIIAGGVALGIAIWRGRLTTGWRFAKGWTGSVHEIATVGLPAATARGINPAGTAVVTAFVATLGDQAVAGYGAAGRIQAIALVPFMALASGLSPVVGQAWGAGLTDRAQAAMRVAIGFVMLYGLALAVFLWIYATPLALFMTAESETGDYAARYLRVVGLSFAFYGMILAANAALTARSKASAALLISLSRMMLLFIPLAWLGVQVYGYSGMMAATIAANVVAALGAGIVLRRNGLLDLSRPFSNGTAMPNLTKKRI